MAGDEGRASGGTALFPVTSTSSWGCEAACSKAPCSLGGAINRTASCRCAECITGRVTSVSFGGGRVLIAVRSAGAPLAGAVGTEQPADAAAERDAQHGP